jgi:hypothetical protein
MMRDDDDEDDDEGCVLGSECCCPHVYHFSWECFTAEMAEEWFRDEQEAPCKPTA